MTEGQVALEKTVDAYALCSGGNETIEEDSKVLKQYLNIMYFVDKEFKDVPSTCGGDMIKKPMQVSASGCAKACDAEGEACAGFSYFDADLEDNSGVCFMFTKFKEVTYYTGCTKEEKGEE